MTNLLVRRRSDLAPWFDDMFGDFWNRTGMPAMPRYALDGEGIRLIEGPGIRSEDHHSRDLSEPNRNPT